MKLVIKKHILSINIVQEQTALAPMGMYQSCHAQFKTNGKLLWRNIGQPGKFFLCDIRKGTL